MSTRFDEPAVQTSPDDTAPILPEAQLYIDGVIRGATGGRTYDVINPWTGGVAGKAADASAEDVEAAIVAARTAFDDTDWSLDKDKRFALMTKLRALFEANRHRLSDLARYEAGAALAAVNTAHVGMALAGWDDLMDAFPKVTWEEDRGIRQVYGSDHSRLVVHSPIGVVGAITPWNVPLYVNVGKVVAALLAGCTVILKPAPDTPGMGSIFGELAAEAGFPAGESLVTDPRVDLITFTGSTGVG